MITEYKLDYLKQWDHKRKFKLAVIRLPCIYIKLKFSQRFYFGIFRGPISYPRKWLVCVCWQNFNRSCVLYYLTLRTRALVLMSKIVLAFSHFWNFNGYFTNYWTNTKHVCTYLNAFFIEVSNMAMKFYNFDIFTNFVTYLTCRLH